MKLSTPGTFAIHCAAANGHNMVVMNNQLFRTNPMNVDRHNNKKRKT